MGRRNHRTLWLFVIKYQFKNVNIFDFLIPLIMSITLTGSEISTVPVILGIPTITIFLMLLALSICFVIY